MIVFVVQNPAKVVIGTRDPEGGGMGYFDITECIGIEFDNWPNGATDFNNRNTDSPRIWLGYYSGD
jgi:hypothetical protein